MLLAVLRLPIDDIATHEPHSSIGWLTVVHLRSCQQIRSEPLDCF